MIRLGPRKPPAPPPSAPSPLRSWRGLLRDFAVVLAGVSLGAIISTVQFLFYAEPLKIRDNQGRAEVNRLRLDFLERTMRRAEDDIKRLQDLIHTHRHGGR